MSTTRNHYEQELNQIELRRLQFLLDQFVCALAEADRVLKGQETELLPQALRQLTLHYLESADLFLTKLPEEMEEQQKNVKKEYQIVKQSLQTALDLHLLKNMSQKLDQTTSLFTSEEVACYNRYHRLLNDPDQRKKYPLFSTLQQEIQNKLEHWNRSIQVEETPKKLCKKRKNKDGILFSVWM